MTFINEPFRKFFLEYMSSTTEILTLINDGNQFFNLHKKLLTQLSVQQAIVAKSTNVVTIINNDNNVPEVAAQIEPQKMKTTIKQKPDKFKNTIFMHCIHEGRFEGMKRDIHEIHNSFFKDALSKETRLLVGNRNNPNTDFEMARKRPHSSLLKIKLEKKRKRVRCQKCKLQATFVFRFFYTWLDRARRAE